MKIQIMILDPFFDVSTVPSVKLLSLLYILGLPDSVNAGERLDDSALPVGHVTDRPNIDRRLSTDHLDSSSIISKALVYIF
jgi:hypothetical protein